MVTEFNGFDKGVIGKKFPSDSTLNNMKKAELIELLHIAEHNHSVLVWFYKNACDDSKCHRCPLVGELVNVVGKTLLEAFEGLTISDVDMYKLGYKKALDDFKNMLIIEKIKQYAESDGFINLNNCSLMIYDVAEQLKEGILSEQINK